VLARRSEWHTAPVAIAPETKVGPVRLAVADGPEVRSFYERVVGLREIDVDGDVARLGGDETVVELAAEPATPPRPPSTTGLFHLAILVPDRAELARSLRRVVEAGWPLAGASDHLVSEALYLADPEGNGIEIYRDRPREEWRRSNGELEMATLPLDLRSLLAEAPEGEALPAAVSPQTRLGHVHLQVSELTAAEEFYAGVLGFEVTVRGYPGALFVSAGGYHHHIGLNTWAGAGAPTPPPGSRGLRWFEIVVPDADELRRVEGSLRDAGADVAVDGGRPLTADPSGNGILIRAASG
jgi:catechol 2,3-dioxygenase